MGRFARMSVFTFAVVMSACAKQGATTTATPKQSNWPKELVPSPDGSAFVLCSGECSEEMRHMMENYKPPTQAELDQVRAKWIYELEHPKKIKCDLPTIPWTAFKIEEGGEGANLPGYIFWADQPSNWSNEMLATRPQIGENDKPIGVMQQGNTVWLVYRQQQSKELVTCEIPSGRDIPSDTCDPKYASREFCNYSQRVIRGH